MPRDLISEAMGRVRTMSTNEREYFFDGACLDLAELFLVDVAGVTREQKRRFAEAIQRTAEDMCCQIEIENTPQIVDSKGG